ncbi:MAG: 16S rRNA (uracil(1498)-N(3))-methyltransferase [Desulfobacterota bacterium]|jgi:16S rRNA (uracil1498-N3)-methyltransferase|nr:16S rRNA (uracil(1498)-N(3))-methyltransferase [Thermodesulfobacteriota bacterium]
MRRFFIDDILSSQGSFAITGAEAKHIARVLRMRPGERLVLLDKEGRRFQAVIQEVDRHQVLVVLEKPIPGPALSPVHVTLCQALLKSRSMDLVVEKTSELGVDRILPFLAERTVVKVAHEQGHGKLRHWQEIARSAAKQSDRAAPAEIRPLCPFEEMLALLRGESALKILLWEQEAKKSLRDLLRSNAPASRVLAVVGPEGGFTEREVIEASEAGFVSVSLGDRILRAETAAVSLVTILQYEWGDLGLH